MKYAPVIIAQPTMICLIQNYFPIRGTSHLFWLQVAIHFSQFLGFAAVIENPSTATCKSLNFLNSSISKPNYKTVTEKIIFVCCICKAILMSLLYTHMYCTGSKFGLPLLFFKTFLQKKFAHFCFKHKL